MAITPNSQIRLLSVPFEIDNRNQLTFSSVSAQSTYFLSLPHLEIESCSYVRRNNVIRWPGHIDSLLNYNYVMYKNNNYSNKWFYAYIEKMEYNNDGLTDITIKQDVFQTWFNDLHYKKMFVEREHVNSDEIGEHIVEENLNIGDYITNAHNKSTYGGGDLAIVMGTTLDINNRGTDKYPAIAGSLYNNIYSGVAYFTFYNRWYPDPITPSTDVGKYIEGLNAFLEDIDECGQADGVLELFLAPIKLVGTPRTDHTIVRSNTCDTFGINQYETESTINHLLTITDKTLDGYTPVNKKLLLYPYRYLMASNNNGSEAIYRYEDFYTKNNNVKTISDQPQFNIKGCVTPGCSIRMIPINYKGVERNDAEGINLGKFPTLSWNSDAYTNWLTQNGINIAVDTLANLTSVGIGAYAMPEGGGNAIVSGLTGIARTLGNIHQASLTPNQAKGNLNCGDVITANGDNDFHFYDVTIKKETAIILDNFFSMFGYKVNDTKIPNITGRTNWNYVKTIDANITADIPQEDLQEIKNIFNNGVTFWHNPSTFLDYSQSNSIVS